MTKLLLITSSLNGESSHSSQMANEYLATRRARGDQLEVTHRDLHANPIPHLSGERFTAFTTEPEQRSRAQQQVVDESDALINELRSADEVVIGLPMYNLGVPSTFKAWIDHVARAGETFRYTEKGPVGLLEDRPVTVLAARGGQYQGTEMDTQTPYVRHIFGLFGISNLHFIYAEGLNMGEAENARQSARLAMAS
ncbi:MAG: NAD(P)H-dependent oxidoreductase [Spongiibacter sp.]|uniref:FMN dependent NADH:quinone oxidoreductase n=1 Tax=Spongiibacter thalassae TaxID=2721624 RepID=A0ABX1GGL1_9GAMM|nr:NAD(P)H-dependent oxidoreductase [Spongiibacter thalassae]MDX1505019.1 NAD(P)H-dependent oxidoreductase [Spongiibacter sp.]NKI18334.1 FMN-dependent NADH-azoreductase [Spongiibacter thalassae]